jgi:hypothetical protein
VYSSIALWRLGTCRAFAFFAALASVSVIILSGVQMLVLTALLMLATFAIYPFQRRASSAAPRPIVEPSGPVAR